MENEKAISVQVESSKEVLSAMGVRAGMSIDEITETIRKTDAEITNLKDGIGKRLFGIGVLLKDVRDRKLAGIYTSKSGKTCNIKVEDWASKTFGYSKSYTLGLVKVASNFNADLCDAYGASKLIQIGTREHLNKLQKEQGITPSSTLAEVKAAIKAEKESKPKTAEQVERENERHAHALKVAIETLVSDGKSKEEIRKMVENSLDSIGK